MALRWNEIKFTPKYINFIKRAEDATYTVAEGAWRSGKTVAILTAHIRYLDNLPVSGLHIIAAESISTARVILLSNPSSVSYSSFFAERATQKQYEGKDALYIRNKHGKTQILIFVGASKSNSWTSIRGLSALSVLITEVNLAHSSFLDEAIGRTLATESKYRKFFFDLNPKSGNDWFYKKYLEQWQALYEQGRIDLNYEHFIFMDNPGIKPDEKKEILMQYDPESVVYKAYILGLRISQADNIFTLRTYNLSRNLPAPTEYVIAVDPGISTSSTVFVVLGHNLGKFYVYDIYHHKNGRGIEAKGVKEYSDYAVDLVEFTNKQMQRFGHAPKHILIDNDIAFYRILTNTFRQFNLNPSWVRYATKDRIDDRIRIMSSLLYQGILVIDESLTLLTQAIQDAVYDPKELEQNGKLVREDKPRGGKNELNFADFLDPTDYAISWAIRRFRMFGMNSDEVN